MEFQVLKRSHLKRNIIIAVLVVSLISSLILNFTQAKYRTTESISLIQGTINYAPYDYKTVAMYLDGEQIDSLSDGNYELTSESYCTNEDNEKVESLQLNYDSASRSLIITPMDKKGIKCYLYFVEKLCPEGATACNTIIAASKPQGQTTDWTGQTTYYYTGNPDNWFQFAGFWWRIIRVNGDGTIRMIYQGTSANEIDVGTQIQTSAFNSLNNHNRYVGYMYGSNSSDYNSTHNNITSSTIKGILDTWYKNNLEDKYDDKIDGNAGFCGDKEVSSGTGGGTTATNYQPYTRISNSNPSLSCNKNDIYTIDKFEFGNGALKYPIGLISADEAMFAGLPNWKSSNQNNYLYTGQVYWTISPSRFYYDYAYVLRVDSDGSLYYSTVDYTYGVRPVINLRADVQLVGSGTTTDPFRLIS